MKKFWKISASVIIAGIILVAAACKQIVYIDRTPAPDITAPNEVANFTVTAANGNAVLTWQEPDDSDLAGVQLSVEPAEGTLAQPVSTSKGVSSLAVTGLMIGRTYTFTAKTFDKSFNYSEGQTFATTVINTTDYDAPENVEITEIDAKNGNARIIWTNPEDTDFAGVQISASPAEGTLANAVCVYKGVTELFVSGLTINQEYTFTLKSYDTNLNYAEGAVKSVTVADTADYTAPGKVNNLKATAADGTAVITWTNPVDTDLAFIKLSASPAEGSLAKAVMLEKDVTGFECGGLKTGSEYTFYVKAYDESYNESEAESITVTVADTKDYTAPKEVTNISITASNNEAVVTWTNPGDTDFAGTKITMTPAEGTMANAVYFDSAVSSLKVAGLELNKEYSFKIQTYDTSLNYSAGSTKAATVADNYDHTAPGKVTNVAVTAADGNAVITWTNPEDGDFAGVQISASPAEGTLANAVCVGKNVTGFSAAGLTVGSTYTISLKTYDTSLNYSDAEEKTVTVADTKDYTAPKEVTNISITASNNEAIVTWTNPGDTDFAGTKITMTPAAGTMANAVYFDSAVSSLKVAGLELNKKYSFKIQTYDTSLNYSAGSTKAATVADNYDHTAPGKVTNLKAECVDGVMKLSWTNPADTDFYCVKITAAPAEGTFANPVYLTSGNTFETSDLTDGTAYTFTITTLDNSLNESEGVSSDSVTFAAVYSDKAVEGKYTIYHLQQDTTGGKAVENYVLKDIETNKQISDSKIDDLKKTYEGFTAVSMTHNGSAIYIFYNRNTITLKFKINVDDETVWLTKTGLYGAAFEVANPTKEDKNGYHFNYWTTDGSTQVSIPATYPLENTTYIANWHQIVQYKVSYMSAYGTAPEPKYIDCHTALTGDYLQTMDNVTVEGTEYEFKKWIKPDGTRCKTGIVLASNLTLTAVWGDLYNWYEKPIDVNTGALATADSTYIYFGVFPKTVLPSTSEVTIDETKSVTMGANTYYKGSDGEYYAKVTENAYDSSYTYTDTTTIQQSNANSTRYFKVEPIKWKVLTTEYDIDGTSGSKTGVLLFAEDILIGNVPYYISTSSRTIGGSTVYANNYKYSTIRAYLNGSYETGDTQTATYSNKGFLQTAFTEDAQNLINTTTVDNSKETTGFSSETYASSYACADTEDKIFLLSESEVINTDYGFANRQSYGKGNARIRVTTDFAKANYVFQSTVAGYGGWWWLRSPTYRGVSYARSVGDNGDPSYSDYVNNAKSGVVPALSISLQ